MRRNMKTAIVTCLAAVGMIWPAASRAFAENKIVHLELKGPIAEAPDSNPFGFVSDKQFNTRSLIDRLKQIRNDESVEAVFMTFEDPQMGLAQLQELRQAIGQLKTVDKEVYIHLDSCYSTGLYWLASSASRLAVVPTGDVWVTGLYGEQLYLKNALGHLRVEADVIHIGDYKSAGEILSRSEPSKESAEMLDWLFDDIYRQMLEEIAESRGMKVAAVRSTIDSGPHSAESARRAGLIDEVADRKTFVDAIKARHGDIPFDKDYGKPGKLDLDTANPFALFQEIFGKLTSGQQIVDTPAVALVYVVGNIIVGEGDTGPFAAVNNGASTPLRKALYEAAYDDNIKAVVLRVDSPGGSAVASDIIWNATQEVAKHKPMIVSMGNVAGSGGYYVSCGADRIFAEPGTITGSIGVVGVKLVTKGMWDRIGVNWYPIQRGENADIWATDQPWSDAHRAKIRGWMEDVYGVFKSRVESKRKDKLTKPLEDLAGGRVYTGAQALELGLVDELGGLHNALKHAALAANLGDDYEVRVLPKPKNIFDMIFENFSASLGQPTTHSTHTVLQAVLPVLQTLEPQKVAVFLNMLEQIQMLQKENVMLVMPSQFVIR